MTIEDIVSAVQRSLGIDVDGRAGPQTWGAIYTAVGASPPLAEPAMAAAPTEIPTVDSRSEKNIASLLYEVQPYARALVQKAARSGIQIRVINGFRTYAEQDELYAKGRTTDGKIVTHATGGFSNHNFGIAFDVGVFEGSEYLPDSAKYKAVGVLGQELGLEWGGELGNHCRPTSFPTEADMGHRKRRTVIS
jgi:peptidoglycan L-alanyl-D-glutamate endopeptidase CwlK